MDVFLLLFLIIVVFILEGLKAPTGYRDLSYDLLCGIEVMVLCQWI